VTQIIAAMLKDYEQGKLSRRKFIQGLAAIVLTAQVAPASESTFQGVGINHIALRVANIPRSKRFYQKHLGLPVLSESQSSCFLRVGEKFLALFRGQKPRMDHYCLEIEDFNSNQVLEKLKQEGLNPRRPAGTNRVYFPDPDGLTVQLSSVNHRS